MKWAVKDTINFLLKVKRPVESDAIGAFPICHPGLFGSFTLDVDRTSQHASGKLENAHMYTNTNTRTVQTVYVRPQNTVVVQANQHGHAAEACTPG